MVDSLTAAAADGLYALLYDSPTFCPLTLAWKGMMSYISYRSIWHLVLFTLEENLRVKSNDSTYHYCFCKSENRESALHIVCL